MAVGEPVTDGGSGPVPVVAPAGGIELVRAAPVVLAPGVLVAVVVVPGGGAAVELEVWWLDPPHPPTANPAATAPIASRRLKARRIAVDNPAKSPGCQMSHQTAYHYRTRPKALEYDALRRRLWIFGQRCHHGAAGSIAAGVACMGLIAEPAHIMGPAMVALATGAALMLHDWKDRSIWFERGRGSQP